MFKTYTGWQYLLIDAATQYGHDKATFEQRIAWAEMSLHQLEALADRAESKPLYLKAVQAIRKAQQGQATGHLVGVDGCCSGIQVMSALTGCVNGATATGMVDPDKRADAYSECTSVMNDILGAGNQVQVSRKDAKAALMTSFYGSKLQPKSIFGEDTPELAAFYEAAQKIAPGAWDLLQTLLASWQPYALMHRWVLPDGFDARIKVMKKMETRIEVDELDHASFTYEYYDNIGSKTGLSNAANVTHSVDAYILRCMHRRLNYDPVMVQVAADILEIEMISRSLGQKRWHCILSNEMEYYMGLWQRTQMADVVILPYLNETNVQSLDQKHLEQLATIVNGMLQYQPFELVTIHDEFKAHPNNVNWVRWQYKEILAELSESTVLDDILSQIYQVPGTFPKLSQNLGSMIRNSNYALC